MAINYKSLPVYEQKDRILQALEENQVIVVQSPTGSGKTTQLPVIKKIYDLPHNDSSLIRVPVGRDTGHTIDTLAVQ